MSNLWMRPAEAPAGTYLVVFRCCFSLTEKRKIPFRNQIQYRRSHECIR